jgi:hypothetical protein
VELSRYFIRGWRAGLPQWFRAIIAPANQVELPRAVRDRVVRHAGDRQVPHLPREPHWRLILPFAPRLAEIRPRRPKELQHPRGVLKAIHGAIRAEAFGMLAIRLP